MYVHICKLKLEAKYRYIIYKRPEITNSPFSIDFIDKKLFLKLCDTNY